MEFDQPLTERLPFHDPNETDPAHAGASAPSRDARIRHLQRVPLFSGFEESDLRKVAEKTRIVEAPAGTVITDGSVTVRTPVGAGTQLKLGDFFGEMSLLDGDPRSATIVASTDVRLLAVDRDHFWRLLEETPDLMQRILMILSRRVRRLEQTVHAILHGTNPT